MLDEVPFLFRHLIAGTSSDDSGNSRTETRKMSSKNYCIFHVDEFFVLLSYIYVSQKENSNHTALSGFPSNSLHFAIDPAISVFTLLASGLPSWNEREDLILGLTYPDFRN